jgi:hypothetical protein
VSASCHGTFLTAKNRLSSVTSGLQVGRVGRGSQSFITGIKGQADMGGSRAMRATMVSVLVALVMSGPMFFSSGIDQVSGQAGAMVTEGQCVGCWPM